MTTPLPSRGFITTHHTFQINTLSHFGPRRRYTTNTDCSVFNGAILPSFWLTAMSLNYLCVCIDWNVIKLPSIVQDDSNISLKSPIKLHWSLQMGPIHAPWTSRSLTKWIFIALSFYCDMDQTSWHSRTSYHASVPNNYRWIVQTSPKGYTTIDRLGPCALCWIPASLPTTLHSCIPSFLPRCIERPCDVEINRRGSALSNAVLIAEWRGRRRGRHLANGIPMGPRWY